MRMRDVSRGRSASPSRTGLALGIAAVSVLLVGHAGPAAAQTGYIPYFGKNNIHYDTFEWQVYQTDHFEIYYYPELEKHLERVAGYAESAYQKVSADLHHDLSAKVQMILFKTHSEFEQQNVIPGAAQEGVGAFVESSRGRMLLPIDDPPDRLYGLITHELTHSFENDIIPPGLIRRGVPLWVMEGLSDYERGDWVPADLMMVRDAAVSDIVPAMSRLEGYGQGGSPRLVYNLGHAVFEFIEARFGKEGLRQFLFALRKSVIGGGEDAYEEAFKMQPDEFDQAFERYLKERFKPFRDRERPADYGRNLAPNPEKSPYIEAMAIAPSPSGDLIAAVTANRKDREYDIVLLSTKDRSVVRNLTGGFDKDLGFTNLVAMNVDRMAMHWMSWSPKGDRLAYFVRTEKERTLIVQNVLTRKIEVRVPMKSVDEPESPSFSPDGRLIAFSALRGGIADIYTMDLETLELVNLTTDDFFDYGPTYALDGKFIIYNTRVSGNQKLFRLDLASKQKTQITFGTHDEASAQFIDDHTIVFSSTATDPATPLDPEVARNSNIYNVWTLDLNTGELKQFTDALGGNISPVVLRDGKTNRIAFISYYKGEYSVHVLDRTEPLHTVATSDFGAPGPIIDFQAPLAHSLVTANSRKKGAWEKMFLEGRPPVALGVSSGGDVFGGTQISFGDVLGDKQINLFAASIAQYRTLSLSLVNLSRRFQFALQGFSQTQFFYGDVGGIFYDPSLAPFVTRDLAVATRTVRGGSAFGIYPFDRYRRVEMSAAVTQLSEQYQRSRPSGVLGRVPGAADRRAGDLSKRHARALRRLVRPGDDGLPGVRAAGRQHDATPLRCGAEDRRHAFTSDVRRRRALLPADREQRRVRREGARLQEHRRLPRLYLLWRQLGDARLRLPRVHRPERRLRQRRAPVPDHRSGPYAHRRRGRRPGRVVREHGRRLVPGSGVQVFHERYRNLSERRRLPAGCRRQDHHRPGDTTADSDLRRRSDGERVPAAGWSRVLRNRPRDVCARLPDSLRLGLANPLQQGMGRRPLRSSGGQ